MTETLLSEALRGVAVALDQQRQIGTDLPLRLLEPLVRAIGSMAEMAERLEADQADARAVDLGWMILNREAQAAAATAPNVVLFKPRARTTVETLSKETSR